MIAITGFMGAGKSSVGRALAALLQWRFIDLDDAIEHQARRPIRELFRLEGEPRFREIERECLKAALDRAPSTAVLALGGGTFVDPRNADLLRRHGATVVFLECPIEILLQRCRAGSFSGANPRPLAYDEKSFRSLYEERLPQYRTAELNVDASGKSTEQVAREIAARLRLAGDRSRT
jgi:shikimate kinase